MAKINLLDVQTANLIAAGEVVERPANVLKELLENAIDAKSSVIVTEIEEGGTSMIRISDNGVGMEKEDLPLCIRRHATSKIRAAEDLTAISTLGFRGEALAAISSTSRFTVLSKRREDPFGHQMTVEGETVLSLEECGCADGTTVIVRDLFFNQPARKKFLKRNQTESAAILQYLQRIAVSHPEIAFRHTSDGVQKLQTVGNGKLYDCIYSVYGKEFASALVPVEEALGDYTVKGFITRPEAARNNHSYQSFYINSRYVKSRTMQFALEDAYKSFVKSEKFPGCILFLELDPERVDVNVHPAKLEVRFSDERAVYNAVYRAVRNTLSTLSNQLARDEYFSAVEQAREGKNPVIPSIRETRAAPAPSAEIMSGIKKENKWELPLFSPAKSRGTSPLIPEEERILPQKVSVEKADFTLSDKPQESIAKANEPSQALEEKSSFGFDAEKEKTASVSSESPLAPKVKAPAVPEAWQKEPPEAIQLSMEQVPAGKENPLAEKGSIRGVLFSAFILYEANDRVYLIDKHAAHERILYESLKKSHREEAVQLFLEPRLLRLPPVEAACLAEHLSEFCEAGFFLEDFGEDSFLLRGIPLELTRLSPDTVLSLLEKAAAELQLGGRAGGTAEARFDRILYSMACKAAVKAGIPSSDSDHEWLVEKIREIDNVTVCPHGRPILISYTKKEIENLFLRT